MSLENALTWLQNTPFATAIQEGDNLFPWIEATHVVAIATVVGTISIVDLRLLGMDAHIRSLQRLMAQLLPVTWVAFVIAATSGVLMFSSKAVKYAGNWPFRIKMLLLLAAGINMIVFHSFTQRGIARWDVGATPPAVKLAGGASLALWIAVIVAARWIGFTII